MVMSPKARTRCRAARKVRKARQALEALERSQRHSGTGWVRRAALARHVRAVLALKGLARIQYMAAHPVKEELR